MPNRYCRDELILKGLNLAQLPNLLIHDAPDGVVKGDAYCIEWLQDIIDFWYHLMPFSATVQKASIVLGANNEGFTLPEDFIIDVKNGLIVQKIAGDNKSYGRAVRLPLQKFINRSLSHQGSTNVKHPEFYCIASDDGVQTQYQRMQVTPVPNINVNAFLWYYKLPPLLDANQKPKLPDSYACIEYIRLRALEWAGINTPGIAQKFCTDIVAKYKASGLMNEPEDDEIPVDTQVHRKRGRGGNSYNWMGPV